MQIAIHATHPSHPAKTSTSSHPKFFVNETRVNNLKKMNTVDTAVRAVYMTKLLHKSQRDRYLG